ncbi:MAG: DUF397 domain-containing protein [Kibdelosporangium sp.]
MDSSGLTWRKSSRSGAGGNAACVELACMPWHMSGYSSGGANGACVEVASPAAATAVRDSKAPASGVLTFPAAPWAAFLKATRVG